MSGNPPDFASAIFLGRLVERAGQTTEGWTGTEMTVALEPDLLKWEWHWGNEAQVPQWLALRIFGLVGTASAETTNPAALSAQRQASPSKSTASGTAIVGGSRVVGFPTASVTRAQYDAAQRRITEHNEIAMAGRLRYAQVLDRVWKDAEAARLTVLQLNPWTGEMMAVSPAIWRTEQGRQCLSSFNLPVTGQWGPAKPGWLYVAREAAEAWLGTGTPWRRGPREPIKTWVGRPEVRDEARRRVGEGQSRAALYRALESMSQESGIAAPYRSIRAEISQHQDIKQALEDGYT